jgi:hypothetical protein
MPERPKSKLSTRANSAPLVFLDTNVLKFAAERLIRGRVRPSTVKWGDQNVTMNVTQFVEVFPNARADSRLRAELQRLPFLAHLARTGKIRLATHTEVWWEFYGLPKTDDARGVFYGAPIERCSDPFPYGRIMAGGTTGREIDHQFEFLKGISQPRYNQLKIAVGVNAEAKGFKNQLLDAFHLLCAETSRADYFLTLDFKLLRHLSTHKRYPPLVDALSPRHLTNKLIRLRNAGVRDAFKYCWHQLRTRNSKTNDPYEQLVDFGKTLEDRGYFDNSSL